MALQNTELAEMFSLTDSRPVTITGYAQKTSNAEHLAILSNHSSGFVLNTVIKNPATPHNTLIELWNKDYRRNLIATQIHIVDTPAHQHILTDEQSWAEIGANKQLSTEHIEQLLRQSKEPKFKNGWNKLMGNLASNPATPQSFLVSLYEEYKIFRDDMAGNPATPQEILIEIARAGNYSTIGSLIRNPSAPFEALSILMDSSGVKEREKLLIEKHPNFSWEAHYKRRVEAND